jgi:hypothetical protein
LLVLLLSLTAWRCGFLLRVVLLLWRGRCDCQPVMPQLHRWSALWAEDFLLHTWLHCCCCRTLWLLY